MKDLTKTQCFVHGVALNGDGSCVDIDDTSAKGKPVWLHLDYSENDCAETLSDLGLPITVVESLVRTNTRPRTLREKDGFIVFLRAVNLNPGDDIDDMVSLRAWFEKDRLITIRQRRVFSIQDIRKEMEAGKGPTTIQGLFLTIIERLADRISEVVDDIEEKIGNYEDTLESLNSNDIRIAVSNLRRQSAQIRRYLAPQREALDSFYRLSHEVMSEKRGFELHEQTDRIIRYVEDLDLVRERCLVLQEELMNRIAQEQNARTYVLSIVAAIFLPISFITGLFGMNVAGLPGIEEPMAFNLVSFAMGAIVVGIVVYFRTRKWL